MINPTSGTIKCNFKVKFGLQRVWHDSWGSLKFLWWICMRVACGDRDQEDEGQFWIFQTRKRKLLAYCMNYCHKDGQKDELWLLWSSSWTGPSSCPYVECIGATFSMIIDLNHTKGSLCFSFFLMVSEVSCVVLLYFTHMYYLMMNRRLQTKHHSNCKYD